MPEWWKIVLTAVLSFTAGIGSSVLAEIFKSRLTRKTAKQVMFRHLCEEFESNWRIFSDGDELKTQDEVLSDREKMAIAERARHRITRLRSDRFEDYFKNRKELFYELESYQDLVTFYLWAFLLRDGRVDKSKDYDLMIGAFAMMHIYGWGFHLKHSGRWT